MCNKNLRYLWNNAYLPILDSSLFPFSNMIHIRVQVIVFILHSLLFQQCTIIFLEGEI